MSKRIACTLTDLEWDALIDAIAVAECDWDAELDTVDDPRRQRRRITALDRALRKLANPRHATPRRTSPSLG